MSEIFLISVLLFLYFVICVKLMSRFRKKEFLVRAPWAGKVGIEREVTVLWQIVITPFVLLGGYFMGTFVRNTSKAKEG